MPAKTSSSSSKKRTRTHVADRGEVGRIVLQGQVVRFPIRRSQRRSVAFAMEPRHGLTVTAPWRMGMDDIVALTRTKEQWILANLARHEVLLERQLPKRYASGEQLRYRGRLLQLSVRGMYGRPAAGQQYFWPANSALEVATAASVTREANALVVRYHYTVPEGQRPAAIREALRAWYIERAEAVIPRRVHYYAELFGRPAHQVIITGPVKRWGSCNPQEGIIRINWRLILAPPALLDYVAAHEICHLKHAHHGPRFWSAVAKLMPDMESRRAELRDRELEFDLPQV